ncbi:MAG: hypothetical protein ACE5O2_09055 [Armatimonadota bacterium]
MDRRHFLWLVTTSAALSPVGRTQAAPGKGGAMRRYVARLRRDLRRFRKQQLAATEAAGERLAERVAAGGRLLIYDRRGAYSSEAVGRAGGLMAISRLPDPAGNGIAAQDALIIVADEAAADEDLSVAAAARRTGALVVGICPVRAVADSLAKACDIALDNYVTDEDAAVTIEGLSTPIAPTSGVMNCAILWALTAAYIEAMERGGKPPHVWMSIKRPGAREFNAAAREAARERGY